MGASRTAVGPIPPTSGTGGRALALAQQAARQIYFITALRPLARAPYPGSGKRQDVVPVFADIPAFQATATALPGVAGVQPQLDGTVTALVDGQPVRVRPDFTVTRSPGTSKRILAEGGDLVFEAGDGRRQRFTIVP